MLILASPFPAIPESLIDSPVLTLRLTIPLPVRNTEVVFFRSERVRDWAARVRLGPEKCKGRDLNPRSRVSDRDVLARAAGRLSSTEAAFSGLSGRVSGRRGRNRGSPA